MRIILVLAVIGSILTTISLGWISIKVTEDHFDYDDNIWNDASTLVICMDFFMLLSVFDICIFCQFCRHKIKTIYQVRNSPYVKQKDWEMTQSEHTKSVLSVNNNGGGGGTTHDYIQHIDPDE